MQRKIKIRFKLRRTRIKRVIRLMILKNIFLTSKIFQKIVMNIKTMKIVVFRVIILREIIKLSKIFTIKILAILIIPLKQFMTVKILKMETEVMSKRTPIICWEILTLMILKLIETMKY